MKSPLLLPLSLILCLASCAGPSPSSPPHAPQPIILHLYSTQFPATSAAYEDTSGRIWKVSNPSMIVYFPPSVPTIKARPAIIVNPGGAYSHLTRLLGADGTADRFGREGIVIIALKYRLVPPSKDESDALFDAAQAMRLVRAHAAEWNIDQHKVGMLGWSAGSNLALNLATHCDTETRPDFVCLLCPWPARHDISHYPITKDAPPAFIASALDDTTAPTSFSQSIANAYERENIPHTIWIIPTGGHQAFALNPPGTGAAWPDHFIPWLKQIGMLDH